MDAVTPEPRGARRGRRALNIIGGALGVFGAVFVFVNLWTYRQDLNLADWTAGSLLLLLGLSLAYALTNLILWLGWHALLKHLEANPPLAWSLRVYATTQLSKYIPGNVFQFAGRQVMGAAAGIGQKTLARSTLYEVVLLCIAAGSFLPLGLPILFPGLASAWPLAMTGVCMVVYAMLCILFAPPILRGAAAAYAGQVVLSGTIFLGVFLLAGGAAETPIDAVTIVGAYAVAWLAGLITPGAPAGLGVREVVLVLLLGGISPDGVVLTATIAGRVVTTFGDFLFFLFGQLVNGTPREQGQSGGHR